MALPLPLRSSRTLRSSAVSPVQRKLSSIRPWTLTSTSEFFLALVTLLFLRGAFVEVCGPSTLPSQGTLASPYPFRRAREVASFPSIPSVFRRKSVPLPGGSFSTLSVLGLCPSKFFALNTIDPSFEASLLPCRFLANEPSSRSFTLARFEGLIPRKSRCGQPSVTSV